MSTLMVASGRHVSHGIRNASSSGFTLAAAVVGFFVITLDAVVVNVALPSIRDGLGGGITGLLGGVLTVVSWRLIFVINVPAGAVTLLLLSRVRPSPHRPAPFDWAGQITAVLAMGGLTYGAIEAGATGFTAPRVVAAFAVAAF